MLDPEYQKLPAKPFPRQPANEPAPLTFAVVRAIQALSRGEADAAQQLRAFEFITHEMSAPGGVPLWSQNPQLRDFAAGRAFVAQQILAALKVNLAHFMNKGDKKS